MALPDAYFEKLNKHIARSRVLGVQMDDWLFSLFVAVGDGEVDVYATPNWDRSGNTLLYSIEDGSDPIERGEVKVKWTGDLKKDAQLWAKAMRPLLRRARKLTGQ